MSKDDKLSALEFELEDPSTPSARAEEKPKLEKQASVQSLELAFELEEPAAHPPATSNPLAHMTPPPSPETPSKPATLSTTEKLEFDLTIQEVSSTPLTESLSVESSEESNDLDLSFPVEETLKEKIAPPLVTESTTPEPNVVPPMESAAPKPMVEAALDENSARAPRSSESNEEPIRLADLVAKKMKEAKELKPDDVSPPEEEYESEVMDSEDRPTSRSKLGESIGFLSAILGLVALLGVGNYFYFQADPANELPEVKVDQSAVQKKQQIQTKKAEQAKKEKVIEVVYPELKWKISEHRDFADFVGEVTTKGPEVLSMQLSLTTPQPAALTPEEIVRGEKARDWVKSGTAVGFKFDHVPDSGFNGSAQLRLVVERASGMSRVVAALAISGKVDYENDKFVFTLLSGKVDNPEIAPEFLKLAAGENDLPELQSKLVFTAVKETATAPAMPKTSEPLPKSAALSE